ncbi:uncharacterized protein LOC110688967 [Chenopodium quinoa]|uniref:uncharacterized protein LOC110688967 n=1 Tax=Chenopodium quinoa TaxID=63459 RepID=UPI000B78212C|nr:uncharacterized protein LOC110688967 [Chenopodium quinoa]
MRKKKKNTSFHSSPLKRTQRSPLKRLLILVYPIEAFSEVQMLSRSRGFGGSKKRGRSSSQPIPAQNLQEIRLLDEDETQDDAGATEPVQMLSRSRGFGGGQKQGRSGSQPVPAQNTPLIVSLDEEESQETQDAGATEILVSETQFEQGQSSPHSRELDPDGFWFDDNRVSRSITEIFQGYLREPYRNYTEVDEVTKAHWWTLFERQFTWRPELDAEVRRVYSIKAAKRLRELFYYVTQKCNGKKPKWLAEHVHEGWMKILEDPTFKAKSEQAKKNRRGGSLSNPIEPSHFQGSISAKEHARRLAVKSNGVLPNAAELYLKTHFKEVPGKGSVPCSSKAKRITDAYLKAVEECKEKGVKKDPNQIFLDTVGGKKRGTVPGLGISVDMYYGNKRSRLVRGSSNTYYPSVAQLSSQIQREREENERRCQELSTQHQQQLEAFKAQMERLLDERLQKEREENERRQREYLDEMRKIMIKAVSKFCGVSDSASVE